jgi:phenylacetate-CoA ligase
MITAPPTPSPNPLFEAVLAEVEFAYANTELAPRKMDEAGITPDMVKDEESFRRLPFTDKSDFRRGFPADVLARGRTLREEHTLLSRSSGTKGDRLETLSYLSDLAERQRRTMDVHPRFCNLISASTQKVCRYAAPNCSDVECAAPFSKPQDRILRDGTLVLPVAHDLFATPDHMLAQAAAEMTDYRPRWLYVDPTHLAYLIRRSHALGIELPQVWAVLLTYTATTQVARRQVEAHFGPRVPVSEVISMTEFGWVAMECPSGRMHANPRSFYLEFLNPWTADPAACGQPAELVITSIGDRLLPHIRYRTGDWYIVTGERCPCGHAAPVVTLAGRLGGFMVRSGRIVLTPRQLDAIIGASAAIDVYRLHQLDDDRFTFSVVLADGAQREDLADLVSALHDLLGADAQLEVSTVDYIPGQRSGKFLSCTSAVSARMDVSDVIGGKSG